MKTTILFTTIIILCIIVFTACSKNGTGTDGGSGGGGRTFSCNNITPTFSADVQPILNTVCSINSNCHAGGSTNFGGVLTNHAEVSAKKSRYTCPDPFRRYATNWRHYPGTDQCIHMLDR